MLIDVTRLVQRAFQRRLPTGVDRVGQAYVHHYRQRASALLRIARHWLVLGTCDSRGLFDALLEGGAGTARPLASCILRGMARPAPRCRSQLLINTGHSGPEHPGYARALRHRDLLPLYFVHDLIPIRFPQYSREGQAHWHRQRLQTMCETGKGLIVNSQATRAELTDYARAQGLRLPECVVAPLAPAPLPAPRGRPPLAHDYFVVLGTIEPRKNHALLLQLWRGLIDKLGDRAPRLVVIGRSGWKCEQVLGLLEGCPVLRGYVLRQERCNDRELANWLGHARALLFPSLAEGYGMPLVEALSLGLPVIASDLPVFREIAGAVPEYLDPADSLGWQRAILDYAQPDGLRRQQQFRRLQNYAVPGWSEHFARVDLLVDQWQRRTGPALTHRGWRYVPGH